METVKLKWSHTMIELNCCTMRHSYLMLAEQFLKRQEAKQVLQTDSSIVRLDNISNDPQ